MFSIAFHGDWNIRLTAKHNRLDGQLESLKFTDFLIRIGTTLDEAKNHIFKSLCGFLAVCVFRAVNGNLEYGQLSFRINRKLTEYLTVWFEIFKSCFSLFNLFRGGCYCLLHIENRVCVFRFQEIEFLNLIVKHHLLLDTLITCAESLDFGVIECLLVYVLTGSCRSFWGHNLTDKTLFCFKCLIEIGIERAFGNIIIHMSLAVLIALTFNSADSLL